jgi:hypothetical protein
MQRKGPGICFAFQKGKCRFGARCRFSHDTTAHNAPQPPKRKNDTVSPELKRWKDQVFQRASLGFGLGDFLSQASRLVLLDDSCRQEVVKSLATDRGLEKVFEIVNQDFERKSEKALVHTFEIQIVPFFCVLSDERVMSSPLLERHLGEICQYIYGVGGSRSEKLFAAVVRALSTLLSKSDIRFFTALKATLAVLMKVIDFNSTAKVTPCFSTYATALAAMLTPQSDPDTDALRYQATKLPSIWTASTSVWVSVQPFAASSQSTPRTLAPFRSQSSLSTAVFQEDSPMDGLATTTISIRFKRSRLCQLRKKSRALMLNTSP